MFKLDKGAVPIPPPPCHVCWPKSVRATTFFSYGGTYICLLVPGNASLQNLLYEAEAFCHLVDVVIQSIHQAENESYPLIVS